MLSVLAARRAEYQQRLDDVRARATDLAETSDVSARDAVLKQTAFDGAVAQLAATVDWLDECVVALTEGALPAGDSVSA
jgi:hypothetical protein